MEIPSFFVPFGGEGYWKFRMSSIGGGAVGLKMQCAIALVRVQTVWIVTG